MKRIATLLSVVFLSLSVFAQQQKLPEGWHYGKITECKGQTKAECNMISQANSYNSALMNANVDSASAYLYPDAVRYFRKYFQGQSDKTILKWMFSSVSDEMVKAFNQYEEMGISLKLIVTNIKRKCIQGDYMIIVFDIHSVLSNEKLSIYSDPEETVGISLNNGVNWTFITKNDDTPNILRYKFNQDSINIVMNY